MLNYKNYIIDKNRGLSIVCHRSLWGKLPENSFAGIKNAIESNFSIVEIDVRKSIDGIFFLMHDEDLKRTTNITGKISNTPSDVLQKAFLKSGNGESNLLTNEKIPTLIEVLNTFKGNIFFDIDVKNQIDRKSLISFIHDNNFYEFVDVKKPIENILDTEKYIKEENDSKIIKMIVLNLRDQSLAEVSHILASTNPAIVEITFDNIAIFEEVSTIAKKMGAAIWVNTLDDVPNGGFTDSLALKSPDDCWGFLISKGVSLIQTDYPKILKRWYESKF